jgi:hypothetical protein
MKRFVLFATAFFFLASLPIGLTLAQDEGKAAACDNNPDGKSKDTDHTCSCEHSTKCDPASDEDREAHKTMSKKCKSWCHEDHCSCTNECD